MLAVLLQAVAWVVSARVMFGVYASWQRGLAERAAMEAGLAVDLEAFLASGPEVPDEENAAIPLVKAAESLTWETEAWRELDRSFVTTPGKLPTEDQLNLMRRVIDENAAALPHLESLGELVPPDTQRARATWPKQDLLGGIWSTPPESRFESQRALATFQSWLAYTQMSDDEWLDAFETIQGIQFQADALGDEFGVASHLLATGVRSLSLAVMHTFISSLPPIAIGEDEHKVSPSLLQDAVSQLLEDAALRVQYEAAFSGETANIVTVLDTFADRAWLGTAFEADPASKQCLAAPVFAWHLRPVVDNDIAATLRWMTDARLNRDAKTLPDFERRTLSWELYFGDRSYAAWIHPFALGWIPGTDAYARVWYRLQTNCRRIAVAIAVRLYQADHAGQLPPTLEELVPEYLPAVPRDALAEDAPVRYDAERARVWTVGEDGDDDGGISLDEFYDANSEASWREAQAASDDVIILK